MKKILLAGGIAVMAVMSCKNDKKETKADLSANEKAMKDTANYTTMQWVDSVKDFGTIKSGEKPSMTFKFKNTGNKPLYIISVRPGCGCTTSDYSKEAILPGGEGWVTGSYNSSGAHSGMVEKSILVVANTKGSTDHKLKFTGTVEGEDMPTPQRTSGGAAETH